MQRYLFQYRLYLYMRGGGFMDWLGQMNNVVEYIESHLDSEIDYCVFGKMLCCSTYEFSRVFSCIVGMSVSEYIRRRRLTKAALDIQRGNEKIIDISLKYGYESQSAFTRAFKEMHGQKPLSARQIGISLKTYPKISFALTIKGVNEMNFRIEKKESFKIVGKVSAGGYDSWLQFDANDLPYLQKNGYTRAPFWYVGAYFLNRDNDKACVIGAELKDDTIPNGMNVEIISATTWVVFPFVFRAGEDAAGETYARALTEWLPTSNYSRNVSVPYLEVYGHGANTFEVWVPIV